MTEFGHKNKKCQGQGCRSQIKKNSAILVASYIIPNKATKNITPIYEIESSIIYENIFWNFS